MNVKLPGVTLRVPVAEQVEMFGEPHTVAPAGADESMIDAPAIPPMSTNGATAANAWRKYFLFLMVPSPFLLILVYCR
jgi:hypothetical protein